MSRQPKSLQLNLSGLQLNLGGTATKPNDPAQQSPAATSDISTLDAPTTAALGTGTKDLQNVLGAVDGIHGTMNWIGDLADRAIAAAAEISNSASGNSNSANQPPTQNTPNQLPPSTGSSTGNIIGGGGRDSGGGNGRGTGTGAASPNDDMGDDRGNDRPISPSPAVQPENAQFTALIQAVNVTADALSSGNNFTNRELRALRTQIATLSEALAQNGSGGVADESIEALNRAAHKLTTQVGKLGDSVDTGLSQLEAKLSEFTTQLSNRLAQEVATGLDSLKASLERPGAVTADFLNGLLSKVDGLGSSTKLDQKQLAPITEALSKLEQNQDALDARLKALSQESQQLFRELIDEVKNLKGIGQQSVLATQIREVTSLLDNPKKRLEKWQTDNPTGKKLEEDLKAFDLLKDQLDSLHQVLLTGSPSQGRAGDIDALLAMHKEMQDTHKELAKVRLRSEELFRGDTARDQRINFSTTATGIQHNDVCEKLRLVSEAMHKIVEASHSKHPDLVTLGVEEKLGTSRILGQLDNDPTRFQSKQVLRELHCNGWIHLEQLKETSRGLEFRYKGQYQQNTSSVNVRNPSQLLWVGIAWGTAAVIPALSLGMGVATGSLGIGSAILSCAGLPGKMLESTARSILNSKFKLQLKQQALTLAYSPERMFAEAVGAAKMMQVLSKSVGVLDLWVIRIPFGPRLQGTESNDPVKATVTPCITALRRVVTNWDKMSPNRDATAARSIRKEYEDALDNVVNSAQAASAAWTRFLNPPINVLNQQCNVGLGGSVLSGLAYISKFIV